MGENTLFKGLLWTALIGVILSTVFFSLVGTGGALGWVFVVLIMLAVIAWTAFWISMIVVEIREQRWGWLIATFFISILALFFYFFIYRKHLQVWEEG